MATLDKSKVYGVIFGDEKGRCFEQDGRYFDAAGDEVGAPKPAKAKVNGGAQKDEEKAGVDEQIGKQ